MDTGYSWLILAGAFLNNFIIIGNFKTFGILFTELQEKYETDSGSTTLYISILRLFIATVGPLAGFISMTYSFRAVTFVGGILVCVGFTLSAFIKNPLVLFFTYSTIVGIGFGLNLTPSFAIINYYFKKRRALANGIVNSAGGLCSIAFSPLFRFAFDKYELHGGMLLLGGVFLNLCVGASIFRQPHILMGQEYPTEPRKTTVVKAIWNFLNALCLTFKTILKCRGFILYTIAFSLGLLGYAANFIILPSHLQSRGVSKAVIVLMLMTSGGVEVVSRIVFGRIIDQHYCKPDIFFIINIAISGVMSLVFPFFNSVPLFYVYSICLGLFPGSMFAFLIEIIIPVVGLKLISPAAALYTLSTNVFVLAGMPLIGLLEDVTGNWNTSFRVLGGVHILSSLLVLIWYICNRQKDKPDTEMDTNRNGQIELDNNTTMTENEDIPEVKY